MPTPTNVFFSLNRAWLLPVLHCNHVSVLYRFRDTERRIMTSPWNLGQGLFKINEKWQNSIDHVRLRTLSLQVDLTSCTVSELFDVEEYRYLEIWVRGHWRLLEVTPFDRSHTSFYSSSVITTVISCIVSEIQWYTVQNRDFSYPSSTQHPSGENVENIFAFFSHFYTKLHEYERD